MRQRRAGDLDEYVPALSDVLPDPAAVARAAALAEPEADAAGLAEVAEQPTSAPTPNPVPSQRMLRRVTVAASGLLPAMAVVHR